MFANTPNTAYCTEKYDCMASSMLQCCLLICIISFLTTLQIYAGGDSLVRVNEINPRIRLDIRYATTNNFTGKVLYDSAICLLRQPVALRLSAVQEELEQQGLGLKVFDGYRPLSVQWKLWEIVPDPRYVADPREGSRHNRGAAIDLTLVDNNGNELPMGTPYDDFTEKAHRNYQGLTPEEQRNRALLDSLMLKHGFTGLPTEWWHFDADGWQDYDILDIPFSEL
jgi:D-alanyl-D-alanine dipeptidase